MSITAPQQTEALCARRIPWRKRLWFRICAVLFLICLVSLAGWWWPRRSMVGVWCVGGTVYSEAARVRTLQLFDWWESAGGIWPERRFVDAYRVLSSTSTDDEITNVQLRKTQVDDQWLMRLKRFRKLRWLGLHDRQVGPGLDHLRDAEELRSVDLTAASKGSLVELVRLPRLETISIIDPQSADIGLETMTSLAKLTAIILCECRQTGQLLERLPGLPRIETLVIQDCHGFTDSDLAELQRLPNLKSLDIVKSDSVSDEGLIHLSKLKNLETLAIRRSSGTITDVGLKALKDLPKLTELIVINGDLTLDQLQALQKLLPNVAIRVN